MTDPNRERLDRIYDALEAAFDDMSGDDLREAMRARGKDPDAVVQNVRKLFASITKEHRQAKLHEARAGAARAKEAYASRPTRIPRDLASQRALYYQVAQDHQEFTLQQRDLEALPPEELIEILKQMDALGLLPDESK